VRHLLAFFSCFAAAPYKMLWGFWGAMNEVGDGSPPIAPPPYRPRGAAGAWRLSFAAKHRAFGSPTSFAPHFVKKKKKSGWGRRPVGLMLGGYGGTIGGLWGRRSWAARAAPAIAPHFVRPPHFVQKKGAKPLPVGSAALRGAIAGATCVAQLRLPQQSHSR
jgi:hypothetical protein